jgi:L-ascorbate metabolism protein UlaG (beta-lactamase superfamily)
VCIACVVGVAADAEPLDGSAAFPAETTPIPWPDDRAAGGTIRWTGVAGFVLELGGTRIAFDPFVTRPGLAATLLRRPRPDAGLVARTFGALDAAFVGHAHFDHAMDLPAVAAAAPNARLLGGGVVVELCRRLGVPEARLTEVRDGARVEVGPFRVEAVRWSHGVVPVVGCVDRIGLPERGVPRTPFRYPRGEVLAWRVEAAGRSFFVAGSAGIEDAPLLRQPPADVLVACLAARKGTPRFLERLGERLRPRVLVPCHHDDFFRPLAEPPRPIPTLRWSAFRAEAEALRDRHGTILWLPVRGAAAGW